MFNYKLIIYGDYRCERFSISQIGYGCYVEYKNYDRKEFKINLN